MSLVTELVTVTRSGYTSVTMMVCGTNGLESESPVPSDHRPVPAPDWADRGQNKAERPGPGREAVCSEDSQ